MKRKYIQPEVKTHRLKIETSLMQVVSKGMGGDYTGQYNYDGTRLDPNVNDKTQTLGEDESIIGLPGADE